MKCANCGAEINSDANFCLQCGARQNTEPGTARETTCIRKGNALQDRRDIPVIFDFVSKHTPENNVGQLRQNTSKPTRIFEKKPSRDPSSFLGSYYCAGTGVMCRLYMEKENLKGDFSSENPPRHSIFDYVSWLTTGRELTCNTMEHTFSFKFDDNDDSTLALNTFGDYPDLENTYTSL